MDSSREIRQDKVLPLTVSEEDVSIYNRTKNRLHELEYRPIYTRKDVIAIVRPDDDAVKALTAEEKVELQERLENEQEFIVNKLQRQLQDVEAEKQAAAEAVAVKADAKRDKEAAAATVSQR